MYNIGNYLSNYIRS